MNRLITNLAAAWMLCQSALAAETTGWGTDLTNALQQARGSGKPVLIEFNAPWCPYCRRMENQTFKEPSVAKSLAGFERVAVNIDLNAALAAQHAVRGIPAFVILNADGEETARTSGFMEAGAFDKWLADGQTNLIESAAQKAEFQTRSGEVEQALANPAASARVKGLQMVLDCCERREKVYRAFGQEKLQALASSEPALLLEGLNHPGLMARIRVANLLRDKLGNGFDVDPWEKADVRKRAVEAWKAKLAAKGSNTAK